MSGQKNFYVISGFTLSVSLIASIVAVMFASYYYRRLPYELLNAVCSQVVERQPEAKNLISAVLKEYTGGYAGAKVENDVLSALGYGIADFSGPSYWQSVLFVMTGFLLGMLLFVVTFQYRNKKEAMRLQALADYLEQVNMGKAVILSTSGEDDFSKLEDEIYKTVTFLYHTKDVAVQAKRDFSENLSNIAHQIKTPITAISLSIQMIKQNFSSLPFSCPTDKDARHLPGRMSNDGNFYCNYLENMEKQLVRLTYLEEALLVLSRIDAGTLLLKKEETDVFTILVLAADNLQELLTGSDTSIDIPDLGKMSVIADLDWTMEAVMNLMKNCMEHNHGGTIHCSYAQNPLYTEILIWDEGKGFMKEDIPHLFERFYRGKNAGGGGIGIGLALSKEIIERQNGTIWAKNRKEGGALFEIHIYSH